MSEKRLVTLVKIIVFCAVLIFITALLTLKFTSMLYFHHFTAPSLIYVLMSCCIVAILARILHTKHFANNGIDNLSALIVALTIIVLLRLNFSWLLIFFGGEEFAQSLMYLYKEGFVHRSEEEIAQLLVFFGGEVKQLYLLLEGEAGQLYSGVILAFFNPVFWIWNIVPLLLGFYLLRRSKPIAKDTFFNTK